jgi:multicomponent Na+:H+ antiporter subunit D
VVALLAHRRVRLQRAFGLLGAAGLLVAGVALLVAVERDGPQATQLGGWEAPFGITLVADLLAAIMVTLAGVVGTAAAIHSLASVEVRRVAFGYYVLTNLLLAGVAGAFLTGDLFNLYVWFEVTLIASFVLLALGGERPQLEGAIKYVALNLVASTFFLAAAGLTYGLTGTLNMADLAQRLPETEPAGLVTAIAMLLLVAFGIKAAAFPLFFWLPASYHTPPADVAVLFSGLLTKVGVYALLRSFTLLFAGDDDFTQPLILGVAALTMVTGVLGALAQVEFRRVLSFHIVSQIGYMLLGLGLLTPLALAGAIFFLAHNVFAKTALFIVGAAIERTEGTARLAPLGGLFPARPGLSLVFVLGALSLAGVPPFAGFVGKLTLVRAGLEEEAYLLVAVALAVGIGTLISMNKLWNEAFWKPSPEGAPAAALGRWDRAALLGPGAALALLGVLLGVGAGPALDLSLRAAEQLLDPTAYIQAVEGETA